MFKGTFSLDAGAENNKEQQMNCCIWIKFLNRYMYDTDVLLPNTSKLLVQNMSPGDSTHQERNNIDVLLPNS